MRSKLGFLYKFSDLIKKIGVFIAGISLIGMMVAIVGDVFMRNTFDKPLNGTYEIVEYFLMPLLVLPALPYTYSSGILPKLEELREKFNPAIKKAISYLIQAIEIFIFALLTYYSFVFAMQGMTDEVAQMVGLALIPIWPVYFFLPFAFGFVCLEAILTTINMLAKHTPIEHQSVASEKSF